MINPAMLIPAPARRMAISRGTRLIRKIWVSSELALRRSSGAIELTPTNNERNERRISAMIKYRFFMSFPNILFFIFLIENID